MGPRRVLYAALSAAVGFGFGSSLPRSWGFILPYGFLLGMAVYSLGFRPLIRSRSIGASGSASAQPVGSGTIRGCIVGVALYLGVTSSLLYVRYGLRDGVDLTWPLTTIASLSLVETWMGRGLDLKSGVNARRGG